MLLRLTALNKVNIVLPCSTPTPDTVIFKRYLFVFLISCFVLKASAQVVHNYDSKDYQLLKQTRLTVVYWSDDDETQARIALAFKKHFDFTEVRFISLEEYNALDKKEYHFYLIPIFDGQKKAVTNLELIRGQQVQNKQAIVVGNGLVSVYFTQPLSEKEDTHFISDLTEAHVIMLNDLIKKAQLVANEKHFFFASIKNAFKLQKTLNQVDIMVGKTLIIPVEYLELLPRELWERNYKHPIKIVRLKQFDRLIEEADTNHVLFLGWYISGYDYLVPFIQGTFLDLKTKEIVYQSAFAYKESSIEKLSESIEEAKSKQLLTTADK